MRLLDIMSLESRKLPIFHCRVYLALGMKMELLQEPDHKHPSCYVQRCSHKAHVRNGSRATWYKGHGQRSPESKL